MYWSSNDAHGEVVSKVRVFLEVTNERIKDFSLMRSMRCRGCDNEMF